MIEDNKFREISKNLSYAMIKLTEDIFKKKKVIDRINTIIIILLLFFMACLVYIVGNSDRIFSYIMGGTITNPADRYVLFIFIVCISGLYILPSNLKSLNAEFDSIKKTIITYLDKEFCKCQPKCNCKEEYIKYMLEKKVNILYLKKT